jgi:DNA-binding NarL/FixJ family response regulator
LGLQPTPLQHQSLREALVAELARLAKRAGPATQFYVHGAEHALAPDIVMALFRVAQEAFHNIEKHAAARHVIVGLAFEADAVVLTVEDDGAGFVPAAVVPHAAGGFGLLSMAARTHNLGGTLQVTSHPGHGTAVRAAFPYMRTSRPPIAAVSKAGDPVLSVPAARPIRVLVVDNHTTARQGIRRILDGRPDILVVGEAVDGLAALEQTERLHPDVIVLDLQMPRLSGVETLTQIHATHPTVEVVVLTMFDQDEQIFSCLRAGARGYLLKDAPPEAIVAAVRAASHGESILAPVLATRVVDRFSVLAQREVDPQALTERELEVLRHMANGVPYKAIAAKLNVTTYAVQYHATNIQQKLQARNRGEAVATAVKRGLLKQIQ